MPCRISPRPGFLCLYELVSRSDTKSSDEEGLAFSETSSSDFKRASLSCTHVPDVKSSAFSLLVCHTGETYTQYAGSFQTFHVHKRFQNSPMHLPTQPANNFDIEGQAVDEGATQQYSIRLRTGFSASFHTSVPACMAAAPRHSPTAVRTLASGSVSNGRALLAPSTAKAASFWCTKASCTFESLQNAS